MPRSARSRSIGAMMVLSALALASLASPVSAAGKTRWVDDDGKTSTTSCSGTRTAYKKIQSAVTASAAGDTVKVCPGTYVGSVTIKGSRNGLVLRFDRQTVPPHVEYQLSTLGQSLSETLIPLDNWAERNHQNLKIARERFDASFN